MNTGVSTAISGNLKVRYQQVLSVKPSSHGEQIQTGTFVNGCVRIVLDEEAAVGETVDVVRKPERQTVDGTEAIAPAYVAVVFARKGALIGMLLRQKVKRKIIPMMLMIFSPGHNMKIDLIERISGG